MALMRFIDQAQKRRLNLVESGLLRVRMTAMSFVFDVKHFGDVRLEPKVWSNAKVLIITKIRRDNETEFPLIDLLLKNTDRVRCFNGC